MSVNLESVLKNIQSEKNTKLIPNNIRKGVTALGVQGILQPTVIDGGDVGLSIYLQNETPIAREGVWINTDKIYDDIYVENESHTNQYSFIFSNDTTQDSSNVISGRTIPVSLLGSTYCQRGNIFHFFGYYSTTSSNNTTTRILQHYKYDFSTNTWTQLADCPTAQGMAVAQWVENDIIYIIGSRHTSYYDYVYKYHISTDTWERVEYTLSADTTYPSGYCTNGVYNPDDNCIYICNYQGIYKYDTTNDTLSFVTKSKVSSNNTGSSYPEVQCTATNFRPSICLHNGKLYTFLVTSYSYYYARYTIATSTWTVWCTTVSWSGRFFGFIYENTIFLLAGTNTEGSVNSPCARATLSNSTTGLSTLSTDATFSTNTPNCNYPIGVITTEDGIDVLLNFYGTSASTMLGIRLHDKEYEFENNTLLITGINTGKYGTQVYINSKIINGNRWVQYFDNIHLWDATNEQMLKTLPTYYGNGTDWIQIK